jgi:beta-glucanase (GH16 family)
MFHTPHRPVIILFSSTFIFAAGMQEARPSETGSCMLRPVFLEEFDDLSISPWRLGSSRWTAHTPWNGDFGDARFVDPGPDGPFQVENGILKITASKGENGKWISGLMAAADKTGAGSGAQYGYFEARMKMPPGPGTWPAFWLVPLKPVGSSDGNVEIDVIEFYGHATASYQSAMHVWYKEKDKQRGDLKRIEVPDGSLVEDFHNYSVDISPQRVVIFFDGQEVWDFPTPAELDGRMYPLVNLALGSGWPIEETPNPSTLEVDYVRVYERDAGPPEGCPPGPPNK